MAKQAKGMKSITNLAFETTYGTVPSTDAAWYRQPINKNALTGKKNLIQSNTITGRRDAVEPAIGQMDASGQLELPMDVRNIGNILKGIFGAPTTSAAGEDGLYKHVFTVGDEIPSLTVEKGFPDISLFYQYPGTKLNKFSLTAQVGNTETTYSNGTKITVNYTDKTVTKGSKTYSLYDYIGKEVIG